MKPNTKTSNSENLLNRLRSKKVYLTSPNISSCFIHVLLELHTDNALSVHYVLCPDDSTMYATIFMVFKYKFRFSIVLWKILRVSNKSSDDTISICQLLLTNIYKKVNILLSTILFDHIDFIGRSLNLNLCWSTK